MTYFRCQDKTLCGEESTCKYRELHTANETDYRK